ncbi:zinc finger protein 502-like [Drosophila busckii]|uniref:zinc finger protein 502-like n=1 Tax=Drosophila busckii TaxID=30019 RepID=UPI00083EF171|nr:zinc finger protein 502-like [Drosophila busckii]
MALQCRACGEPIYTEDPRNIFKPENKTIRLNIEALTGIHLRYNLELPSHICSCCYLDLDYCVSFRERCLEAQGLFTKETVRHKKPVIPQLDKFPSKIVSIKNESPPEDQIHVEIQEGTPPAVPARKSAAKQVTRSIQPTKRPKKELSQELKYVCHYCGWKFRDPSNLNHHVLRHTGIKKFKCEECERKFGTRHEMLLHVRVYHRGETPFKCKFCDAGFRNRISCRRHQRLLHASEMPFECNICKTTYVSQLSFDKHKLVHLQEEEIPSCSICNRTFKGTRELREHKLTKTHQRRETEMLLLPTESDLETDFSDYLSDSQIEQFIKYK